MKKLSILLFFLFLIAVPAFGQQKQKIDIDSADYLEFITTDTGRITKLVGNVILRQEEMRMTCDSAHLFQEANVVHAYGDVHINQADTIDIFGDKLFYDGNTKRATLTGNVRLNDGTMRLTTEQLNYNLDSKIATYTTGATLKNEEATLTSEVGYYYANTEDAYFRKNVELRHPDYQLFADTLRYNIQSKIAYFFGPTDIVSDENKIYTERGWYDTSNDQAFFHQNVTLENPPQTVAADTIYYDRSLRTGWAFSNMVLVDTARHFIVNANEALYFELENRILAYENPVMTNIIDRDSLHMAADTLVSIEDTVENIRTMYAYHNVRIFKRDLQGLCDSLVYSTVDSVLEMYAQPILWTDSTQLSGDTIFIYMHNNSMDEIHLKANGFIGTQKDSLIYDLIKGKYITGHWEEDTLRTVDVEGNSEAVYYLRDDGGAYIGVNKSSSSEMTLFFNNGQMDKIISQGAPEGVLTPMQQVEPAQFILEGFRWRGNERPQSKESLTVQVRTEEEDSANEAEPSQPETETETSAPNNDR